MTRRTIALSSTALVVLCTSVALGRGITPIKGMAVLPQNDVCFARDGNNPARLSYVGTSQSCINGSHAWTMDGMVDYSNNWHAVTAYGRGDGNFGATACVARSSYADGFDGNENFPTPGQPGQFSGWAASNSRTSATWGAFALGSVWVPTGGNLHFSCTLPLNGGISAIHYDP